MKCPGQDSQYWKPGAIFETKCPKCGAEVEFFKDDSMRRCAKCGHKFLNPSLDFGCASYCQYAEQCIGNLPPELIAQKEDLLKDRVAIEMKRYFKNDFKRIGHASRVATTGSTRLPSSHTFGAVQREPSVSGLGRLESPRAPKGT